MKSFEGIFIVFFFFGGVDASRFGPNLEFQVGWLFFWRFVPRTFVIWMSFSGFPVSPQRRLIWTSAKYARTNLSTWNCSAVSCLVVVF